MEIKELYAAKGELTTAIEINQARLNQINQQIAELLNKPQPVPAHDEKKEEIIV